MKVYPEKMYDKLHHTCYNDNYFSSFNFYCFKKIPNIQFDFKNANSVAIDFADQKIPD